MIKDKYKTGRVENTSHQTGLIPGAYHPRAKHSKWSAQELGQSGFNSILDLASFVIIA